MRAVIEQALAELDGTRATQRIGARFVGESPDGNSFTAYGVENGVEFSIGPLPVFVEQFFLSFYRINLHTHFCKNDGLVATACADFKNFIVLFYFE